MPQKQKTPKPLTRHKPVKKKTPPASSLSKLHWNWKVLKQTLLIILGLGILFLIALNRYHAHQTHLAQQAQLTRLNAASTDLKKVYDQLLTTLPNIREHSFEKSCGRASDTLENGIITCGAYASVIIDTMSNDGSVTIFNTVLQKLNSNNFKTDRNVRSNKDFFESLLYTQKLKSRSLVPCSLDTQFYYDKSTFLKHYNTRYAGDYSSRILWISMYCRDTSHLFLKGYEHRA